MSEKPMIYGYCSAGCKWEVPHKSELENIAAYVRMAKNALGNYSLEPKKTYKISTGEDNWGFKISISWSCGVAGAFSNYSAVLTLPEFNKLQNGYSREVKFKLLTIDALGGTSSPTMNEFRAVYEWNGVVVTRNFEGRPIGALYANGAVIKIASIILSGADNCLIVNDAMDGTASVGAATSEGLGGIKVGETLTIADDGTLDVKDSAKGRAKFCGTSETFQALINAATDATMTFASGDVYRILNAGGTINGLEVGAGDYVLLVDGADAMAWNNWRVISKPEALVPEAALIANAIPLTLVPSKTRFYAYTSTGYTIEANVEDFPKGYVGHITLEGTGSTLGVSAAGVLESTSLNGKALTELGKNITNEYIVIMRGSKTVFDWYYLGGN